MVQTYGHQGILQNNASNTDQTVEVKPDRHHTHEFYHPPLDLGNMEIWYFDIYDTATDSVYIIQFTLGPDAFKKRTALYATFHACDPHQQIITRTLEIPVNHLSVQNEPYKVQLGNSFIESSTQQDEHKKYSLNLSLSDIQMQIELEAELPAWKPFGNEMHFYDQKRKGIFSWIPAIPKANVKGTVKIKGSSIELTNAHGYYDHTYWKTGTGKNFLDYKLFWDDAVVRWEWLKIIHEDYKIAFNEFEFRPWLQSKVVTSFMISRSDEIIHSSNNLATKNHLTALPRRRNARIKPTAFQVFLADDHIKATVDIKPTTMLKYQDLLEFINPVSRPIISFVFGRPTAFYTLAEADVKLSIGDEQIEMKNAKAFYEPMVLNNRPTRWEDKLRLVLSKKISRR